MGIATGWGKLSSEWVEIGKTKSRRKGKEIEPFSHLPLSNSLFCHFAISHPGSQSLIRLYPALLLGLVLGARFRDSPTLRIMLDT